MDNSLIKRILVADDDESYRIMLRQFFQSKGYVCEVAHDAREALARLRQEPFDLLLTDIKMPGKDGIELTQEVKASNLQIDIIVMSGYAREYPYTKIIAAGAADFINKPFQSSELQAKIYRLEREKKIIRELQQSNETLQAAEEALRQYRSHLRQLVAERTLELQLANEQLQREIFSHRQAELQAVSQRDLALALSGAVCLEEAMLLAVEAATRMAEMDGGGIYVVDPSRGVLSLKFQQGLPVEFIEMIMHYEDDSPQAGLLKKGQAIYTTYKEFGAPNAEIPFQAVAFIPIHRLGELIACLVLVSETAAEVSRQGRDAVETIVSVIGNTIARIFAEQKLASFDSA